MATTRLRKVKSRKELEEAVDDFITQGYKVKSEGEMSCKLKKSEWGSASMHIIILLLGGVCLCGVANLIYALIAHSGGEEVLVKVVGQDSSKPMSLDDDEDEDDEPPPRPKPSRPKPPADRD